MSGGGDADIEVDLDVDEKSGMMEALAPWRVIVHR